MVPGRRKPPTLTLKRGLTADRAFWDWNAEATRDALAARRNAELVIYDFGGTPTARYTLRDAWPARMELGALRAGASELLVETVTIVCEELQRVAP